MRYWIKIVAALFFAVLLIVDGIYSLLDAKSMHDLVEGLILILGSIYPATFAIKRLKNTDT